MYRSCRILRLDLILDEAESFRVAQSRLTFAVKRHVIQGRGGSRAYPSRKTRELRPADFATSLIFKIADFPSFSTAPSSSFLSFFLLLANILVVVSSIISSPISKEGFFKRTSYRKYQTRENVQGILLRNFEF